MSMPSPASSHPSSRSSLDYNLPTMGELNNIVRDQNFLPYIEQRFQYGPRTTSQLLHFMSLSWTIQQLESTLQGYYTEQEALFIDLQDDETFQQRIQPVYRYYWQIYPHRRATPYQRSERSTSSSFLSRPSRNASPRFTATASDALLTPLAPPSPPSPTATSSSSSYRSATSGSLSLGMQ